MTKQTELVVMTHHDLDALGCMLNIEYKMPGIPKKYFHTNYSKWGRSSIMRYDKKFVKVRNTK